MRFGVTLLVQFWPSAQPSNPALTNRRPQRPTAQPCCLFQLTQAYWSQACLPDRLRDLSSDSRSESRELRRRCLFFWSFKLAAILVLVVAVTAALSLGPGFGFDKDTCVLTRPLPPPPSNPVSTHTQLLFPACFIRFDTPHPPAIVRTRKGRMELFVGIGFVVFVCVCLGVNVGQS